MNKGRFHSNKTHILQTILIIIAISAALLVCFSRATAALQKSSINTQRENLTNAVNRDITEYYTVYGYYPESLNELRQTYHLTYDENIFFIDYQVRGSNIRPDVTIIERDY